MNTVMVRVKLLPGERKENFKMWRPFFALLLFFFFLTRRWDVDKSVVYIKRENIYHQMQFCSINSGHEGVVCVVISEALCR